MKLVLTIALALAIAFPADAEHCTTWSTSNPEIDTTTAGGFFYVDNDFCNVPEVYNEPGNVSIWFGHEFARIPTPVTIGGMSCLFSVWYYEESNDIPGLQRGDEVVDDTCHGMIQSDSILF